MQISPYFILVCVLDAAIMFTIVATRKNINKRAAKEVFAALVLAFFALIFYGLSLLILDEKLRFIFHELKFLPLAFIAPCSLMVYAKFTEKTLSLRSKLLLCFIPALAVMAAQTNGLHHIFREDLFVIVHNGVSYVETASAWGYWVYSAYSYALYIIGIGVLASNYYKKPRIYRDQIGFMIITAIAAVLTSIAVIAGAVPDYGDISLITCAAITIVQYMTIVNYSYKRVTIKAWNLVVGDLDSIVMIFDHKDGLVDSNKDASRFSVMDSGIISFPESGEHFSINEKRLYDKKERYTGRVFVIKDVSDSENTVKELEHITTHDYLTGLNNRLAYRRGLQTLDTRDCPTALICVNILGTKLINDIFGNEYGDRVIIRVANELDKLTEKNNSCARLGGDEMGIILRNTEQSEAEVFIHKLKDALSVSEDMIEISLETNLVIMTDSSQNASQLFAAMSESMRKSSGAYPRSISEGFMNSLQNSLTYLHDGTGERLQKIIELNMLVAEKLELCEDEKKRLRLLSVMSDISLLSIPPAILKLKGELSNEQWNEWKLHPIKGHNIALSIHELSGIANEILTHHERYDGYGYPMKLKGDEIPLLARIFAAVEFFADSPDASAPTLLRARSGTQFDPDVTDAILSVYLEIHKGGKAQ